MKIQNEKIFNCIANTKKGNFDVIIKVWEGVFEPNEKFKSSFFSCTWKSESYVIIDGGELDVSFNIYDSTKIKSYAVAKKYKMEGETTLMCDCSHVKNYIDEINDIRINKNSEADMEILISKTIHNL